MEFGQRMENLESQNLSNIQTAANNNENIFLQDISLNTISDLNEFNQKLTEDQIFCNNVVPNKQYIYMAL